MEVGDIYFPFVCLLPHISVLHSFLQIASRHHLQVIWSFPTELCVAALVGADYWMHGCYRQPLEWPDCPNLDCCGWVFCHSSSRERGNGGGS